MVRLTNTTGFPMTKPNIATILAVYKVDNFEFSQITTGIVNTTYLISTIDKKYILRIYQYKRKQAQDIKKEIAFQNFLQHHHIPVPHVFKTTDGKNIFEVTIDGRIWQAILMEYMTGQVGSTYTQGLLKELALLQAKMHLLGRDYVKNRENHAYAMTFLQNGYAQKVLQIVGDDKVKQLFLQQVHSFQVHFPKNIPYGYNHLDLDLEGNVLTAGNRITAILDFDDVMFSPLVVCLGYTLWHIIFSTNSWESVWEYLTVYETKRTLIQEEKEILLDVMKFRNFSLGCLYLELGNDGEDFQKILALQKELDTKTTAIWQ